MKTVQYKGLTITGDDVQLDKVLYELEHKEVKTTGDAASFSDILASTMKLNSMFWPKDHGMTFEEKVEWTKQYIGCINSELAELKDELPWKHWKNYDNFIFDEHSFKMEAIDVQIFLMAIYNLWGMDGDEIMTYLVNKMGINFKRQEGGY